MEIRLRLVWIWAGLAGVVLLFGLRAGLRAHRDLVTLNVRNADVRKVARKLEWQTWESIVIGKEVQGKVTLNVKNAPLESVLEMISGQVSGRYAHLYPVYRKGSSLRDLQRLLAGGSAALAEAKRWTNFSVRDLRPERGGRGGWAGATANTNHLIQLSLHDKPPGLAALTLAAAARVQVVPEDGIALNVNLELANATPHQAVQKFAKAVHRRWQDLYTLQAGSPGPGTVAEELDPEIRRERMAARMDALTPEQRARMEEMRNLSPEERQARMQARMEDPAVQQQMVNRSLNSLRMSTPEQIVQRKRQRQQMAQNFQRQGQNGQPLRPPFAGAQ